MQARQGKQGRIINLSSKVALTEGFMVTGAPVGCCEIHAAASHLQLALERRCCMPKTASAWLQLAASKTARTKISSARI
jgi:hypothetical protein